MKSRTVFVVVSLIAIAGVLMLRRRTTGPVDLSDLEESETASRLGIPNGVPNALLPRARGLAVVVGELRDAGLVVTSMYRSPLLQAAIEFQNANPGQTPDVSALVPRGGEHTLCLAVDVDGPDNRPALDGIAARIRSLPLTSRAIRSTLVESNHVHIAFSDLALVKLGVENV